ncbi:MAG: DUF5615 family PIN-like protein [Methylobacteriaceae bacterium]|nr:DUF5615 family PIN-like protein [Methylobacteriaceae bacterium]MBV9243645.1 DUF5615 family PIN-like protein [Methylobacteriaceae bacterium]
MSGFLIDDCLSPALVGVAKSRGHIAVHLVQIGRSGASDLDVMLLALAQEHVLVTNNRGDFLRRYAKLGTDHPGLIVVRPNSPRAQQIALFEGALTVFEATGELTGSLVEVAQATDVLLRPWPPRTIPNPPSEA